MIGKIRKGRSFGGCIRYVTQKDDAEIIASEGVLLGTAEETARSFRWQCLLSPDVAKPVGHIALSFKPEEKKWLDNQEVCLLLKVSPRTLQTLRDNGTLAYTQICHKTYYKPGDVESIIRIVEERRKRAESMGKSI
jgi:hypothetical protein